jgi:NAD-dependent dihydropyrimidine dehydrogenase PreA subunit
MAYVITDACVGTCDTACVDVCPCDCIAGPLSVEELRQLAPGDRPARVAGLQLYIDPEHCIDCDACLPECPVGAIFPDDDVPADQRDAIRRNAEFFTRGSGGDASAKGTSGRPPAR